MATAPAATASGLLRFAASPLPLLLHLAGLLESLGLGLTAQLCSGVMQQVSVRSRLRKPLFYPEYVYLDIMVGVQRFRCLRMGEHVMALRRLFDIAANVVRQLCRLVSLQHVLYRQHALPCELLPIRTRPCPDACDCSRFLLALPLFRAAPQFCCVSLSALLACERHHRARASRARTSCCQSRRSACRVCELSFLWRHHGHSMS